MERRIINVTNSFSPLAGGLTTAVRELSKMFMRLGVDVNVVTCDASSGLEEFGVNAFRRSFPARYSFSQRAAAYINGVEPRGSICLMHGVWAGIYHQAASICRSRGIPYAICPHGSLDPFDLQKGRLVKRILGPAVIRKYLDGAAGVVCSASKEREVLETYGAMVQRFVVPWPVSEVAPFADVTRQCSRRALGIEEAEFVVLFMSRINYKKGLDWVIDGFEQASKICPGLRLLIAGAGEHRFERIIREKAGAKMGVKIDFLGHLEGREKANALSAADLFALVSDNENFGFSVIEALDASLPCLISKEVYIWSELVGGGASWVCERDARSVAQGILEVRSELANRGEEIKAAAMRTAARFRPEMLTQRYRDLLELLVSS